MAKYLKHFPKPLLADLVGGRWLPVVGAGLSLNAEVPKGSKVPLWSDLASALAADLDGFEPVSTLDAISEHEHSFGRSRLIERVSDLLMISSARPGRVHKEFCGIPFDTVVTTNFDYLLERQYASDSRFVYSAVEEEQLSLNVNSPGTLLLKLHGDLNHPERLVLSERDYDQFISRYPLLVTYLANLLIRRTAVLIGYSLDDPDFRHIWQIVNNRLGRNRRQAYAISVGAKPAEVSRFARRGVTAINLPGSRQVYGEVLSEALAELRSYYISNVISVSSVMEERPLQELSLPSGSSSSLCFFSLALEQVARYRDRVFPFFEDAGFVPVTSDDVISPGDSVNAKIEAMIERSAFIIVEPSSRWTLSELSLAVAKSQSSEPLRRPEIVVVISEGQPTDFGELKLRTVERGSWDDDLGFGERLAGVVRELAHPRRTDSAREARRLLNTKEYRAAVVSALSILEVFLRQRVGERERGPSSLSWLVLKGLSLGHIPEENTKSVRNWMKVRNEVVHAGRAVSRKEANEIVTGVEEIVRDVDQI